MGDLPTLFRNGFLNEIHKSNEKPLNYILENLKKNDILILKANTGSGKSTILPPALYSLSKQNVISTQPRVFNAISLPPEIIKYNKYLVLGENIGYQTGSFQKLPKKNGIIFMTVQTFAFIINNSKDEDIYNYPYIIIDEAHEMDLFTSVIHMVLKNFLKRNRGKEGCPKIIITSATFDYVRFAEYYETKNIILVEGQSHPITEHFLEFDGGNYLRKIVKTVIQINKNEDGEYRDILIFMAGSEECEMLLRFLAESELENVLLMNINRGVVESQNEVYKNIFKSCKELKVHRKVMLITNVGETGITYPFMKYIIDSGYYKSQEYSPDFAYSCLFLKPVSKMSMMQRRGRVGRNAPGDHFPIYTKECANYLKSDIRIYKEETTADVLHILKFLCGYNNKLSYKENYENIKNIKKPIDVYNVDLIIKPSPISIRRSLEKLYVLGFIDHKLRLTISGIMATFIPKLSIESIKMILAGYVWKANINDLILIACLIENKGKFNSFDKFLNDMHEENYEGYEKIMILRDEVLLSMASIGLNPYYSGKKSEKISISSYFSATEQKIEGSNKLERCFYEGFKLNIALWKGEFYETLNGVKVITKFAGNILCYTGIQIMRQKMKFVSYINLKSYNSDFTSLEIPETFNIPDEKKMKYYHKFSFRDENLGPNFLNETITKMKGGNSEFPSENSGFSGNHFRKIKNIKKIMDLNPDKKLLIAKGLFEKKTDSYFKALKLRMPLLDKIYRKAVENNVYKYDFPLKLKGLTKKEGKTKIEVLGNTEEMKFLGLPVKEGFDKIEIKFCQKY